MYGEKPCSPATTAQGSSTNFDETEMVSIDSYNNFFHQSVNG